METQYNLDKLKDMRKEINNLNENEHIEILNIIKLDGLKYTENNNGVFVNMKKLSTETLEQINTFICFCKENYNILNKDKNIRQSLIL